MMRQELSLTQSPISYLSDQHVHIITQTLETMCVTVRHEPRGVPYLKQTSLKVSSVSPADHKARVRAGMERE